MIMLNTDEHGVCAQIKVATRKIYEDLAGILTLPRSKVRSIKNGPLTPLMRSSTLSCGKERMAAIVRIRRSEREYLL